MKHQNFTLPKYLLNSGFSFKEKPLSTKQINFLIIICSYIVPGDSTVVITKKELSQRLGLHNKTRGFYRDLRNSLFELQGFKINVHTNAPTDVDLINILEHKNIKRENFITVTFTNSFLSLFDFAVQTPGFTTFEVSEVLKLEKGLSKRIYMLLENISPGENIYFTIAELRKKLHYENKYLDNTNFYQRALVPAQLELMKTNRAFKLLEKKEGKKLVGFTFSFSEPMQKKETGANTHLTPAQVEQTRGYISGRLGLNTDQANYLIKRVPIKDITRIGKIIEKTFSESRNGTRNGARKVEPGNYAGYSAKAFRNNYHAKEGDLFARKYIPFVELASAQV